MQPLISGVGMAEHSKPTMMKWLALLSVVLIAVVAYWQQQPQDPTIITTTIFKSIDSSGQVIFSDRFPKNVDNTTVMSYRSDTNILPPPSDQIPALIHPAAGQSLMDSPSELNIPLISYTQPQRVIQLFEDAKDLGPLLQKRQELMKAKFD